MKLYIANGTYVGTQAEAKKLDKGFEPVEVPTDKEGLIAYLNYLADIKAPAMRGDLYKHADGSRECRPAEGSLGGAERIMGRMDRQAAENALRAAQDAITHGLSLLKRKHSDALQVETDHLSEDQFFALHGKLPEEASPLLD